MTVVLLGFHVGLLTEGAGLVMILLLAFGTVFSNWAVSVSSLSRSCA